MLKTWNVRRGGRGEIARRWLGDDQEDLAAYADADRPKTRADCVDGARPCPWVSCRYHLALDVNPRNGAIKLNFGTSEIDEMPETCALDVADRYPGGAPLPVVAEALATSYDRTFQIVDEAKKRARSLAHSELVDAVRAPAARTIQASRHTSALGLYGVFAAVHAYRPVLSRASAQSLTRAEVEQRFPGVPISEHYGAPRPQPRDEGRQSFFQHRTEGKTP
jgi:hypothetical protein